MTLPSEDPDDVANQLVVTEGIVPFFTWCTEVEQGVASTGRILSEVT